jgi:hypothetical protein
MYGVQHLIKNQGFVIFIDRESKNKEFMKEEQKSMQNIFHPPPQAGLCIDSLGERLKVIIMDLPPDKVTLAEIRDLLGQEGLLLLTAFLTIVFLIPVSIPGVSTVFGAAILLIGVSRLLNRSLWLPKRFLDRRLPAEKLYAGLNKGIIWFHRLERISRTHRLRWLTRNGFMDALNSCALIIGAGLLMAPFGLIPFSNTLPALAILFLAIGLLQRDGVCILLGYLVNLATIVYFILLVMGGGATMHEIFQRVL